MFDLANVAVLRGKLAVADGNATEAASAFERARQYVATVNGATAGEARVLIARVEYARAVALLEQAMVDEPSAENALLLRDIYLFQGSTAGVPALDTFLDDNVSEERLAGADVDLELGVIEADRGNAAEAVRLAQRVDDTRPENVFTASGLAWALHVAGDDATALPYIDRSLRLGTQDAVFRYRAAVVLAANGQADRAAEELDRVRDQSGLLVGQARRRLRAGWPTSASNALCCRALSTTPSATREVDRGELDC